PTRAEAWHNLGRAYLMSGNLGQALPILRKAILLKPEMDKAAANLGLALISTGQPHEAVLLLEPRLPRATRIPEIHFALGVAYALTGDRDGARRELVALNPLDPQMAALLQEELSRLW
ncbi:MAG: tetratricopeptide repeat protein, partial [Desulfurivibrionaceae bacterium]